MTFRTWDFESPDPCESCSVGLESTYRYNHALEALVLLILCLNSACVAGHVLVVILALFCCCPRCVFSRCRSPCRGASFECVHVFVYAKWQVEVSVSEQYKTKLRFECNDLRQRQQARVAQASWDGGSGDGSTVVSFLVFWGDAASQRRVQEAQKWCLPYMV